MLARALAVLSLVALVVAPLNAAGFVVRLAGIAGTVEVQHGGGSWTPGTPGQPLARGDKVHTGFKSKATLTFPDGSVMEVQPLTLLAVDRLDGLAGEVRSRILLRSGEVKAQVFRPAGAAGEFQVQTPTATASVRGTKIQRIAFSPSTGTRVVMGQEGLLAVIGRRGRVHLPRGTETVLATGEAGPPTPGRLKRASATADVNPTGTLLEEREDVLDLGVPKTRPLTQGGSGLASTLTAPREIPVLPVAMVPEPAPAPAPIFEPPVTAPIDKQPPPADPIRQPITDPGTGVITPPGDGTATRSPGSN